MALEQPECPLTLHALSMRHDETGSTLTLRVGNDGKASVTRYTITAWVMMADGTPKGSQRWQQKTALEPGEARPLSLALRTVRVSPSDAVVLAVLDTQGDAWKGDEKLLEREARAVAVR